MSIVVTAATGHLGQLVIDELLQRVPADQVVAVARNAEKAAGLADRGVEVRIADYNDPAALATAFGAGDTVLLISGLEPNRRAQHQSVIDAAKAAGVARIAYTSVLGGPEADFDLAADHIATEQAILDSGLPYTFLRNGWYHEVYTDQIAVQLEHGVVGSAGDGRIGSASRRDYAAAAAVVLTGAGHEKTAYELNGDTRLDADRVRRRAVEAVREGRCLQQRSGRDAARHPDRRRRPGAVRADPRRRRRRDRARACWPAVAPTSAA